MSFFRRIFGSKNTVSVVAGTAVTLRTEKGDKGKLLSLLLLDGYKFRTQAALMQGIDTEDAEYTTRLLTEIGAKPRTTTGGIKYRLRIATGVRRRQRSSY